MKEILNKNNNFEFSIDKKQYKVTNNSLYVKINGNYVHSINVNLSDNELDSICAILKGNASL